MLSRILVPATALIAVNLLIGVFWWWLGQPVSVPSGLAVPERLQCMSYAPFRGTQSPLDGGTHIPAAQIETDRARLKPAWLLVVRPWHRAVTWGRR